MEEEDGNFTWETALTVTGEDPGWNFKFKSSEDGSLRVVDENAPQILLDRVDWVEDRWTLWTFDDTAAVASLGFGHTTDTKLNFELDDADDERSKGNASGAKFRAESVASARTG